MKKMNNLNDDKILTEEQKTLLCEPKCIEVLYIEFVIGQDSIQFVQ